MILFVEERKDPDDFFVSNSFDWPSNLPSLQKTVDSQSCGTETRRTVLADINIFGEFISGFDRYADPRRFEEGGRYFFVESRPMFPYEEVPTCGDFEFYFSPAEPEVVTPETLSCSPEDGVLPIPAP